MKRIVSALLFVCLCVVVFAGFAVLGFKLAADHLLAARYGHLKVPFTQDVGTVIRDLPYGDDPLQTYDLYLPAEAGKAGYSLVFFVHGGGFTGGDKGLVEAVRHGEYLASKGCVMASANYRLASEGGDVFINDMYEDLMTAVEAVVEKAAELGYPVDEMAATGGSAGGCLAMMVALRQPERLPVPIRFVFEETGPASFEPALWDMQTDAEKAYFVNAVSGRRFTAADVGSEAYQAAIDEISVATMVNDQTVPLLLAYGVRDKIVNPKAKFPLLEALAAHGVEHTYIEFPHSGHGLLGDPDKTAEYYAVMDAYLQRYFHNF